MPYKQLPTGDLPEPRVSGSPAFTHVGVDCTGRVYIKSTSDTIKQMKKAYICLFTCVTSRALHKEAFNRCLRRFTARRGRPVSITTDPTRS